MSLRHTLYTRFFCSDCGSPLAVLYDHEAKQPPNPRQHWRQDDDTGAVVRYERISIEPCRSCIEKHTKPAKQMASALSEMMAAKDTSA